MSSDLFHINRTKPIKVDVIIISEMFRKLLLAVFLGRFKAAVYTV